ncbi:MAG: type II toxin-antitoxin system VapB family antitoxin [Pseudomonadota bacterium]
MAFNVKDPETDRLVRELAARTGEGVTGAIRSAVAEKLERLPPKEDDNATRLARIYEVLAEFDAMPRRNKDVTEDQILGYDDDDYPR